MASTQAGKPGLELDQFRESFETFNNIINNLQRQYLTLEKEYAEQGHKLEQINHQLRQTMASSGMATSFLNSILTAINSGVIAVDQSGKISHFNPAAERITGLSTIHALGRPYDEVIQTTADTTGQSALETALSGIECDAAEKVIINQGGEEIPVSVSTSLLYDADGNHRGAVEILFDMTRVKRLEAELTRIHTLAALGEMAATVAHEVRNPLGGIGGFAALLKREVEDDPAKTRLVDKIITGVETLNRTVTALLDYTRPEQMSMRDISVARLIEESVEYEKAESEAGGTENIDIQVVVDNRNLRVKCDPHLMRQVLLNLLRNSREAMPSGGRIIISAEATKGNGTPGTVKLEVEDSGKGIPEKDCDKIFRPFYSTKRSTSGSGLGLATVWKTVQAHGGTISVASRPGQGTRFTLLLPGHDIHKAGA